MVLVSKTLRYHGESLRLGTVRGWKRPLVNVQLQLQYTFQYYRTEEKLRHGTLWRGQSLWRAVRRGYWWRCIPVAMETPTFWRCQYHWIANKDNCRCGVEPSESWQTVCAGASSMELRRWRVSESDPEFYILNLVLLWFDCTCAFIFPFWYKNIFKLFFLNMCQSHETLNISEKFCNFKETLEF